MEDISIVFTEVIFAINILLRDYCLVAVTPLWLRVLNAMTDIPFHVINSSYTLRNVKSYAFKGATESVKYIEFYV